MKHIKCVFVGDQVTDKTQLLIHYTTGNFPGDDIPNVFDNYSVDVTFDDKLVKLQLCDTAGAECYKKLRPLSYPQTDVFVICFSLVHPISLQNVFDTWVPEIKEHCPEASYILVGTKKEMRDNFEKNKEEYLSKGYEPIKSSAGIEMKKKIQANSYNEYSSGNIYSINRIMNSAINSVFYRDKKQKNDNFLTLGFIGDENSGRNEFALKCVYGGYIPDEVSTSDEDFYKIVEIHSVVKKLKFKLNYPYDLSTIDAFILIYNGDDENSLDNFKKMIDSEIMDNNNLHPCILVAYYENEGRKNMRRPKIVKNLLKDLDCPYFEIDSGDDDDVEFELYSLLKLIPISRLVDEIVHTGKKVIKKTKSSKKAIKKTKSLKKESK